MTEMVNFRDSAGINDTNEPPSPLEYHDIKTADSITKEQAFDFLDNIFADFADGQEVNNIDEDTLITEIFGRSEDEFTFDFEIDDDIQTVLDKFSSDNWENISEAERKACIAELSSLIAEKLGLHAVPEIRYFDGAENACGTYNQQDNSIGINRNLFSEPQEIVDTLAHEMRHAYQYQCALNPETPLDLLYKCNFEYYISPIQLADGKYLLFIDYQDQLIEAEARAFASLFSGKEAFS
jgi:hypothetical protein